ncbi:MAG: allantoicase [Myxococcales bacterium]|nr:allantoicase [Myxococcales bacterium]
MSDDADFLGLIDLAAAATGGVAILANDEFFAEKDNLLRAYAAVWKEHEYTDRGKWMDGWETRRRREPGYDWCIVRLGLPGVIRGVVVDTAFFRGNFPAECSIDACAIPVEDDLAGSVDAATVWTELLPRAPLAGDTRNEFHIACESHDARGARFTHVRLNIFPDGGVARLRVHGEVRPDFARLARQSELVDLAAVENGGFSEAASDMFFGARQNLIAPGRPINMSDGWETRRRRGPGHDWNLVRLGASGTVRRLELDTTHFRGNAPGRVMVEGRGAAHDDWRVLLPERRVQPHTRHVFASELRVLGPITHVRLNVHPCGGVARLRAWAEPAPDPSAASATAISRLNALAPTDAAATLLGCCGARAWAERMAAQRPIEDGAALLRLADRVWWSLGEAEWLEAFAAHPKIGGHAAAADTGAKAAAWAAGEQAGVVGAGDHVRARLAAGNQAYVERFGFTYIVCATGKSAPALLALLEARLGATRAVELGTAAEEQAAITRLRLGKLLEGR